MENDQYKLSISYKGTTVSTLTSFGSDLAYNIQELASHLKSLLDNKGGDVNKSYSFDVVLEGLELISGRAATISVIIKIGLLEDKLDVDYLVKQIRIAMQKIEKKGVIASDN